MKMNITFIVVVIFAVAFGLFYLIQNKDAPIQIDPQTAKQKLEQDSGIVIDVRTQKEYEAGHLAAADHHFDLLNGDFEAQLDSLDKDKTYYLYCRTGNRSGKAAKLMIENGFEQVFNIGGYQNLVKAGLKSEK